MSAAAEMEGVKCAGCGKVPAKMQCPTCIKYKHTEGSYFCDQTCFKANWDTHKTVHKAAKVALKMASGPMEWVGFNFTGPQRPWNKSPKRLVPETIPPPDYSVSGIPVGEQQAKSDQIRSLSPEEIEKMRVACRLGREVLDAAAAVIAVGTTTDEIDRVVHEASVARNCYPSPLNYREFPKSCCTSVNEVICHGIPDGYPLKDGDIVNVDVTVYHNGYHADLNETFYVGEVDADTKRLVKCAYECLDLAIKACKPGMPYRDLGKIITKRAKESKCSVVRTYCGHGINNLFHTAPNIPHYAKNKAPGLMKPGHMFTIEPMINLGVWGDDHWPDNWTAVTKDGKRSAQFEHTMVVTEDGVEVLTGRIAGQTPAGPHWFQDLDDYVEGSAADAVEGEGGAAAAE